MTVEKGHLMHSLIHNIQQYYQINRMRAQIQVVQQTGAMPPKITLIYKPMDAQWVKPRLATKQYKKVGDHTRDMLLVSIQKGGSIIEVAKKFNINYSTAKSIVQSHRKRNTKTGHQHSTDEGQSHPSVTP